MTDKNISTEYTGVYTGIFPNMSPREIELEARVKELKKENEELKAQRDTYVNLMNVYKDISKGREDSKTVTDYISKLEYKLTQFDINNKCENSEYFIYTDNNIKDDILINLHTKN